MHVPNTLLDNRFLDFVQRIELPQRPKAALEIIDERSGSEGLGSICPNTWPEMDIVINQGFRVGGICEI